MRSPVAAVLLAVVASACVAGETGDDGRRPPSPLPEVRLTFESPRVGRGSLTVDPGRGRVCLDLSRDGFEGVHLHYRARYGDPIIATFATPRHPFETRVCRPVDANELAPLVDPSDRYYLDFHDRGRPDERVQLSG